MTAKELVSYNLRRLKNEKKVTLKEIENNTGYKVNSLSNILHCQTFLSAEGFEALAGFFNVPVSDLLAEPEEVTVEKYRKVITDNYNMLKELTGDKMTEEYEQMIDEYITQITENKEVLTVDDLREAVIFGKSLYNKKLYKTHKDEIIKMNKKYREKHPYQSVKKGYVLYNSATSETKNFKTYKSIMEFLNLSTINQVVCFLNRGTEINGWTGDYAI